jgi:hypothetical protein
MESTVYENSYKEYSPGSIWYGWHIRICGSIINIVSVANM